MHEKLAAKILEEVGVEKLPKMIWSQERVSLVCPYRKGAAKFFYDMVTRWLIPGKQLDATLSFAMHYQEYLVAEIVLQLMFFLKLVDPPHFRFEERIPAFGSLYGLASCVAIIVVSKFLGKKWLMRREDYYDS